MVRISSRRKAIAFFIVLGVCLVGLAVALNVGWIILNWREVGTLVLGIIFFGLLIAGLILNTTFLVREIRRNEQHDSFINAVTHELKTPITSIRLYLETLRSRQLEDEQRQEFYRMMLEDTDRLLGTVDQVLRAGEVRQRRRRETLAVLELEQMVEECVKLARSRHHLGSEALTFLSRVPSGQSTVLGHPEELRAAVTNVLENAIKYSGEKIQVSVELFQPDLDHVGVRVEDRGVGIPRAELKQIFKRFYRVPSRLVTQVKGSGLGLFIVRSIARRHGGDAYALSEGEGKGTTVVITLPRSSAA